MKKKKNFWFIILAILVILAFGYVLKTEIKQYQDKTFLSKLQGEVVFAKRGENNKVGIWKINIDGTNKTKLYEHPYSGCFHPQWNIGGKRIFFIAFDKDGEKQIYTIDENGKNFKKAEEIGGYYKNDTTSHLTWDRAELMVEKGDIYYIKRNKAEKELIKIYNHKGWYNIDYQPGAAEVSWNPDKKYVIFEENFGFIKIADLNGNWANLTQGQEPDWKY